MGTYINPKNESKEQWLARNATACGTQAPAMPTADERTLLVCLVNNGPFTAAAVIYNTNELQEFADPGDYRPKQWYLAKIEDLLTVSDLPKHYRSL